MELKALALNGPVEVKTVIPLSHEEEVELLKHQVWTLEELCALLRASLSAHSEIEDEQKGKKET